MWGLASQRICRPGLGEGLEDETVRRALGPGLELAVGEGARAADAKLDVALGVELAGLVMPSHGVGTSGGVVAALHEQGLEAGARQGERAEEARTAGAHDDGASRPMGHWRGKAEGGLVDRAHVLVETRARARGELGAQRERELHVVPLAGVYRAATTLDVHDVLLAHAQASREGVLTRPNLLRVRAVQLRERYAYA